jgi:hypothetical protein
MENNKSSWLVCLNTKPYDVYCIADDYAQTNHDLRIRNACQYVYECVRDKFTTLIVIYYTRAIRTYPFRRGNLTKTIFSSTIFYNITPHYNVVWLFVYHHGDRGEHRNRSHILSFGFTECLIRQTDFLFIEFFFYSSSTHLISLHSS